MPTASDYDSAWKDALESYFPGFMASLWPDLHAQIDWGHTPVFRDKELQALMRSAKRGRRHVDKLVSVRLLNGQDTLLLIHVESWRPRMADLIEQATNNPFAVVILAQLEANATRPDEGRLIRKTELVRRLYHWGYQRDNVIKLIRIIDAMMALPEALELAFEEAIQEIEEETQMSYVTSVERVRLRREREEGKVEGFAALLSTQIARKFGTLPDWAKVRLVAADDVTLQCWAEQILDAESIEDVFK